MTRLLHDIEDYLEDAAEAERMPRWARRFLTAVGRTIGETGDILARGYSRL
jgi:hypothetical protein